MRFSRQRFWRLKYLWDIAPFQLVNRHWNSSRRLSNSLALKIKAQWSFKMPVTIYQWTRLNTPKDRPSYTTHPPILITLISTTYHIRTTWLFVYPSLQDSIPYAVKISVFRSWRWAKDCPKHVELILEINKLLLLHLVGSSILLYLHWWCTVKHKSSLQYTVFIYPVNERYFPAVSRHE